LSGLLAFSVVIVTASFRGGKMNLKLRNLGLPPKIFDGQNLPFWSATSGVLVRSDVYGVWDVSDRV